MLVMRVFAHLHPRHCRQLFLQNGVHVVRVDVDLHDEFQ